MKTESSVIRDLLALYAENMLSQETARFVSEHLKKCPECLLELESLNDGEYLTAIAQKNTMENDGAKPFKKIMKRINRQIYSIAYAAIIFLIFLDFGWTSGNNLMYNSLIMPIVGVFGYYVFKWRAVYKIPVLLMMIDLAVFAFQLIEISFADTLMWTMIYAVFVLVGVAIAFLLHYALGKENKK